MTYINVESYMGFDSLTRHGRVFSFGIFSQKNAKTVTAQ